MFNTEWSEQLSRKRLTNVFWTVADSGRAQLQMSCCTRLGVHTERLSVPLSVSLISNRKEDAEFQMSTFFFLNTQENEKEIKRKGWEEEKKYEDKKGEWKVGEDWIGRGDGDDNGDDEEEEE